ncbi:ATP-binding protein [Streptomyces sp. E11-3]|uniref:ATP-binding protein n=1 Tax=Streptomyces sp. E11-3 TaxID=3110112 RepID=UPI0039806CE4
MVANVADEPPQERLLARPFTARDLPRLRVATEEHANRAGLVEPRLGDFVFAVSEVAANAVEHAGGGTLLLYRNDQGLECRISDCGPGFTEAAIPQLAPGIDGAPGAGRGLWLARLVTDHLSVRPGPVVGAVVTLVMHLR